jgi:hypothetical protein
MNIPKIEEAITLLYQTYIEDQDVATQRGIAITAMNEMVKLLGGADVVKKIESVPYSARLRAQHFFEDDPQPKREWVGLTDEEHTNIQRQTHYKQFMTVSEYATLVQVAVEAKLKEKNT